MNRWIGAVAFLAATQSAAGAEKLVTTDWLRDHLRDRNLVVVEVGNRDSYEKSHIAGARFVASSDIIVSRDGVANELADPKAIESAFRAAGVRSRGTIIIYARDVITATRAFFTLDYSGRGEETALLDGGFAKWTKEELPVESGPQPEFAGDFEIRPNPDAIVRLNAMRTVARCAQESPESVSLVDTRPADAYRSGRIACAINIPWTENLTGGEIPTFRSAEELRQLYKEAGVADDTRVVTYCRTGMQASVAYFVLRQLGRDVHLYDGSYSEWSKSQ